MRENRAFCRWILHIDHMYDDYDDHDDHDDLDDNDHQKDLVSLS